jgi:hypothetical protein
VISRKVRFRQNSNSFLMRIVVFENIWSVNILFFFSQLSQSSQFYYLFPKLIIIYSIDFVIYRRKPDFYEKKNPASTVSQTLLFFSFQPRDLFFQNNLYFDWLIECSASTFSIFKNLKNSVW